ncbi:MAG: prenyltransferase/squalene oxidase repeat-containing protein [Pirellulales bacterium]
MSQAMNRRNCLRRMAGAGLAGAGFAGAVAFQAGPRSAIAARKREPAWDKAIDRALKWVARTQSSAGHWTAQNYPTAMTALAGTALIASGSTTTQGPYAKNIRRAVDYLIQNKVRPNGLIGDPLTDQQYTYGHGFSMLFLSQVLGEEEDAERRQELVDVLNKATRFSGQAQTRSGGWGYVSAKDGNDFDEGSTTITQVQGLRGCRNAGIPVPAEVIDRAKEYIYQCKNADGGISYSFRNRGSSRPAITAAALAALYNAGDYDGKHVPEMLKYCKQTLNNLNDASGSFGHWHYTYLYYAQVVYRQGDKEWDSFRDKLYNKIATEQSEDGTWQGAIGPIYTVSCNLIMLQLDRAYLPIYQR